MIKDEVALRETIEKYFTEEGCICKRRADLKSAGQKTDCMITIVFAG